MTARIAALVCTFLAAGAAQATTLVLVRHGQKGEGKDPELTPAGEAWAERLSTLLAPTPLAAVFITDTRRSAMTAAPAARRARLEPQVRSRADGPAHANALAAELRARPESDVVLAVEHSDTVPLVLKALGVATPPELGDQDYGDVFIVNWAAAEPAGRAPAVLRLKL